MKEPEDKKPEPPYQYSSTQTPQQPQTQIPLPTPEDEMKLQKEIEELKRKISRFFTVYEVRVGLDAIAFHCRMDESTLEEKFELLRNLLKPDYIPVLSYESGEHVLYVTRKPQVKYKGIKVNYILLIATIITTTIAGSSIWVPYDAARAGKSISDMDMIIQSFYPQNLLFGALFFALPLLAILGIHEFGHYFVAKKHGVAASLPFFMPMPPFIMPLGTLGAVISMREPIPNKKALIDIGAAGPIAGIIVAIPVTLIGLYLTKTFQVEALPHEPGGTVLYSPLLLIGLSSIFPLDTGLLAHPTYFAGWVGVLVTALNLLPAGQLDGGHIVRALFGEKTKYIGMATVLIMISLGFLFQYFGYVLLIVIVMVLGGGLSHPPPLNDVTKLDKRRVMVGVVALLIFAVSFHPAPIQIAPLPEYGFNLSSEFNETMVSAGGFVEFNITVRNLGTVENDAFLNATMNKTKIDEGWNVTLIYEGEKETIRYNLTDSEDLVFVVDEDSIENVTVRVYSPLIASPGQNTTVRVNLKWNSWERDNMGTLRERERHTFEEIRVTVA